MKKIIVWIMLSLIVQTSGLYVFNKFICANSSEFKSKKIDINKSKENTFNCSIPKEVNDINLSTTGKYIAYLKDEVLNIEDTKTGDTNKFKTENNEIVMYYTWLYDRDIMAIVEKVKKDGEEKIQLITYDVKNDSKTFVQEICEFEKNIEVKNLTISVFTGVYYIQLNKNETKSMIYRIDRNDDLSKVDINAKLINNMKVIPHEDRLLYEDKINNKIFVTSPNKQLKFDFNNELELLDIDKNDVIYLGEINENNILSILYGTVNEDISTWKKINIDSTINKDDLYCNNENQILINNNLEGYVKNLINDNKIEYDGKFIQLTKDFIVSVDGNGKLIYTSYKDII
ncbi:dipeptidyl-peptidase IV [Clostridium botulinum]|uniref:dipeptidyl-peptidase IV n=1 Tax=Clostridium botulinum TaxID=1491 RepID=UPI00196788DD|nr:dipeptidyl-peptidase IV [Clostridium botulinum]MBN1071785.1 dipeptidyl-peptidase IV [Clostridium botulinum]